MHRILLVFLPVLLALPLPVKATEPPAPIRIVASFSILGDMIRQIGGDDVDLRILVGPNEDAHTYQPTPQDAKAVAQAEIIAINGLKFEGWIGRLIPASGTKAKLLVASAGVRPRVMKDEGQVIPDPHAWQDPRNGKIYIRNIAGALITARPELADTFKKRAEAYNAKLNEIDAQARAAFAAIPPEQRKIITSHDAFGYLAAAYQIRILSPLGLSTEAEATPESVATLIKQIKIEKVKALFIENMSDPRLIEQIAADTGAHVGGMLYPDALSKPDGEVPTYLELLRHNCRILAETL